MNVNFSKIKKRIDQDLEAVDNEEKLSALKKKYLEKGGEIAAIFDAIKEATPAEKAKFGREANLLKNYLKQKIDLKAKEVGQGKLKAEIEDWIDITLPGEKPKTGHIHPITQNIDKCMEIFEGMGFTVVEGPELESEWYNFDALNFPPDHPAREMQDTLFIKQEKGEKISPRKRLLMRTHTSPVQVRYMEKNKPPFRIIVPGRVFRNEATDASHEINFYQLEGLMIDKDISVANFKAVIEKFYQSFYEKKVDIRLRPSFFPFTEPSFEVDMSCLICNGKGCSVCSQTGWLEMLGAGMVHPNVLKNSGIDPKKWRGFAFGMGDRMVMMKHKIDDIRMFYGGDLRFLQQF